MEDKCKGSEMCTVLQMVSNPMGTGSKNKLKGLQWTEFQGYKYQYIGLGFDRKLEPVAYCPFCGEKLKTRRI